MSTISIGEMRKGIEKLRASKRRDATKEWLETDLLIRFDGRIVEITVETAPRAAFEAAWAEGQQMTLEQAIALATENESEASPLPKAGPAPGSK